MKRLFVLLMVGVLAVSLFAGIFTLAASSPVAHANNCRYARVEFAHRHGHDTTVCQDSGTKLYEASADEVVDKICNEGASHVDARLTYHNGSQHTAFVSKGTCQNFVTDNQRWVTVRVTP